MIHSPTATSASLSPPPHYPKNQTSHVIPSLLVPSRPLSASLPLSEVKANVNAPQHLIYAACSKEVDAVMGHDVMKSVANLVPDLLDRSHVLLYQGQFDAECGVASNEAWISKLQW